MKAAIACSRRMSNKYARLNGRHWKAPSTGSPVAFTTSETAAASGFALSNNNGTLTGNNVKTNVSTFDPGIGLRYQF